MENKRKEKEKLLMLSTMETPTVSHCSRKSFSLDYKLFNDNKCVLRWCKLLAFNERIAFGGASLSTSFQQKLFQSLK